MKQAIPCATKCSYSLWLAAFLLLWSAWGCAQGAAQAEHSSAVKAYDAVFILPLAGVQEPLVFVRLQNTGDKPLKLVSVTSPYAARVDIRQAPAAAGKAPITLPALDIPAKTLVDLHKAGPYLQLHGLKAQLQTGDQLHLRLGFSDNTYLEVRATARSAFDQPHH